MRRWTVGVAGIAAAGLLAVVPGMMVVDMAKAQGRTQRTIERGAERTVTVSASGTVAAEPDIAHISTGVVAEADTAREALSRNSATMKKVIDGLKALGIESKDIQTVSFNVEPRYPNRSGSASNAPPQISGYRVVNQVRVTARNLDRLGDVLDQLVSLGANQMGGLSFDVSKAESLKDEARGQAMANALRRAKLFAQAAGTDVGAVLAISEDAAHVVPRGGMARAALESVPIERGSQSLEVRVTVTWALK